MMSSTSAGLSDTGRFKKLVGLLLKDPIAGRLAIDADRSLLALRSPLGETLLHWFAVENEPATVAFFHERGVAIDARSDLGGTALIDCARVGHTDLCGWLLDHGADPALRDDAGESAVSAAACAGRYSTLECILARIAGHDLATFFDDSDAHFALTSGDERVIAALNARGLRDPIAASDAWRTDTLPTFEERGE